MPSLVATIPAISKLPSAVQPSSVRAATRARRDAKFMGTALIGIGTLHFITPKQFDSLVPRELPGDQRTYTYASGVAEVAIGAGLLVPRTQRASATAAAALFAAVFPGNINMVRTTWKKPAMRPVSLIRLPLQIPMITSALRIRRDTP